MLAIGIDLGGTNIKGALVDDQGHLLSKTEVPTLAREGPEAVIKRIAGLILELAYNHDEPISGIGIGVPGQPDTVTGAVLYAPNLKWERVPVGPMLNREFNYPVYLDNDANTAALAEYRFGAGVGARNLAAVTIGTGIGAGLILEGRLFRGSNWSAGELGHTVVLPGGPLCSCGKNGCLETLTAAPALVRMIQEKINCGEQTSLTGYTSFEARDIFVEALRGDRAAAEIINKMIYYLGIGLGNLVNLLNLDCIIIGGGVARAGEVLFKPLREEILKTALPVPAEIVKVIPASLGNDAGSVGAAALVFEKC